MQLMSRTFLAVGAFLIATGVAYGVHSQDYEGLTLMLTTAGGALLIGGYLAQALQRATATAERGPVLPEGEPHVGPTLWPLVFALSMVPLVVGALGSRWVLMVGAVAAVVAGVGWVLDVQRQWQVHYRDHAHSAHGAGGGDDGWTGDGQIDNT
jgi:hypothetical protein